MNYPVPYKYNMTKQAEDEIAPPEFTAKEWDPGYKASEEQKTYADWLHRYYDRMDEYTGEVTTTKHRFAQSLGTIAAALIGAAGGGALGLLLGGKNGMRLGVPLGFSAGMAADILGAAYGYKQPARSKKEQMDYMSSNDGILPELLTPGYAGYQRGRTAKHVNSVVSREIPKSVMNSKVRNFNDVAPA